MNEIKKILIISLSFVLLFMPVFALAEVNIDDPAKNGGLVPCGNEVWPQYTYKNIDSAGKTQYMIETVERIDSTDQDVSGQAKNPCGFGHLMVMINIVVNFILFALALPIAAIMFAYAGFLLLFSGGETSKRSHAKEIFINVAIGVIIAAVAWLAVKLILSLLGYDGAWIGF